MTLRVRDSTDADLPAITAIYAHWVLHGSASFEEVPPTETEMRGRREKVLSAGLPYIVAERGGAIVGYAYATVYRERSAYRFTAEDSIYIDPAHTRGGVGAALLGELIARCEALGCRQMVAVIGDSANAPSIGLHTRFGFQPAGVLRAVGFKFGRWLDSVRMQRTLGAGSSTPPVERTLSRAPSAQRPHQEPRDEQ
ncbi:MAG TPA: GNAT family N-acetyltransferase [Gemmatimonadaceae bacterium]|nr:GNAT family N-acetyltransferase [Gemmatimonadaceae bacterium]